MLFSKLTLFRLASKSPRQASYHHLRVVTHINLPFATASSREWVPFRAKDHQRFLPGGSHLPGGKRGINPERLDILCVDPVNHIYIHLPTDWAVAFGREICLLSEVLGESTPVDQQLLAARIAVGFTQAFNGHDSQLYIAAK